MRKWIGPRYHPKPHAVAKAAKLLKRGKGAFINTFIYYTSLFMIWFSSLSLFLERHVFGRIPKTH